MVKKIMILVGSPRKGGNTMTLAKWVAEGATEAGAEVEIVDVARLECKTPGCTACMSCQNSPEFVCAVKDDATPVLANMAKSSVVVFASPVYFMGFSAQLKRLIDRMYSLIKIDYEKHSVRHALKNTEIALIATAGGDEGSGLSLMKANLDAIAGFVGKKVSKRFCVPFAPFHAGDLDLNVELREKAQAFGSELALSK